MVVFDDRLQAVDFEAGRKGYEQAGDCNHVQDDVPKPDAVIIPVEASAFDVHIRHDGAV